MPLDCVVTASPGYVYDDKPRPRRRPPGPSLPLRYRYAVPREGGGLLGDRGYRDDDGLDLANILQGLIPAPGVTTIIGDMQLRDGYEGIDPEVVANAGRRAHVLHAWISAYIRGTGYGLPELDPRGHGYLECAQRWVDEIGVQEVYLDEAAVYLTIQRRLSEYDRVDLASRGVETRDGDEVPVALWAGTLDTALRDRVGPCVIDWKFRAAPPKPGDGPQVASYLLPLGYDPDPAIREIGREAGRRRFVVGLDPYGGPARVRRYADDGLDERAFLGAAIRWHRLVADAEGRRSVFSDAEVAQAARAVRTWRFVRGTK